MNRLSIVIPVWNQGELLSRCLASLRRAVFAVPGAELIVVDDGSDEAIETLVRREFPRAQLLRNDCNRGFAAAANRGMAAATGEFVLLLNSDTEIEGPALSRLLAFLTREPDYAGVVPRLVDRERRLQKSCMAFPTFSTPLFFGTPFERWFPRSRELRRYFLREFDHETERDVQQPPASCWLLRRASWLAVGEFDESLELFFNDVDWCRRLAREFGRLRYLPGASVVHIGGASTRARRDFVTRWQTDRLRYQRKHFGRAAGLFVKLCASWAFFDWSWVNLRQRIHGRAAEPVVPMGRAWWTFLRA